MSHTATWIKSLELTAGNAAVTTDDAALEAHAVQGVKPACVCAPESPAQAAAVIKFAAENKIPVLPRGGGTGQGIGSPPPANAIPQIINSIRDPGPMIISKYSNLQVSFGIINQTGGIYRHNNDDKRGNRL